MKNKPINNNLRRLAEVVKAVTVLIGWVIMIVIFTAVAAIYNIPD